VHQLLQATTLFATDTFKINIYNEYANFEALLIYLLPSADVCMDAPGGSLLSTSKTTSQFQ